MNDHWVTLIIICLFFIVGFWFIVTSGLLFFVKGLIELLLYKKPHFFGRLSTADLKTGYVEIILMNNTIFKIYVNGIKELSIQEGFMYIHAKYSLRRLNFVADTVLCIPTIIDEQKFNGLFGCKLEVK